MVGCEPQSWQQHRLANARCDISAAVTRTRFAGPKDFGKATAPSARISQNPLFSGILCEQQASQTLRVVYNYQQNSSR
jgi:hypothetical protein